VTDTGEITNYSSGKIWHPHQYKIHITFASLCCGKAALNYYFPALTKLLLASVMKTK